MTKNFDTLLESVLTRLDEAPISMDPSEQERVVSDTVKTASEAPMSGHWKPLKKQGDEAEMAKFVKSVLNLVLPENNNTYNPDINTAAELKAEVLKAVEQVSKKSGWAQKFLADRLSNKSLIGSVTYELAANAINTETPVTQKQFSAALKKKVEEITSAEGQKERIEKNVAPKEKQAEVETVYTKAADLNSDDSDLQKAFSKLPDKELSWQEVVKLIGNSAAQQLLDPKIGALIETEKETEPSEEEPEFREDDSGEIPTIEDEDFGFGNDYNEDEF
jgi:hypothetical protein